MTNIAVALFERLARRRQRSLLLELDDHLLTDIGLSRIDLRQTKGRLDGPGSAQR